MTAPDPASALRRRFESIGPTCVRHQDGRFGVLWFSGTSGRPLAVFPRAGPTAPLDVIRQPVQIASLFDSFEAVARAGWRLD